MIGFFEKTQKKSKKPIEKLKPKMTTIKYSAFSNHSRSLCEHFPAGFHFQLVLAVRVPPEQTGFNFSAHDSAFTGTSQNIDAPDIVDFDFLFFAQNSVVGRKVLSRRVFVFGLFHFAQLINRVLQDSLCTFDNVFLDVVTGHVLDWVAIVSAGGLLDDFSDFSVDGAWFEHSQRNFSRVVSGPHDVGLSAFDWVFGGGAANFGVRTESRETIDVGTDFYFDHITVFEFHDVRVGLEGRVVTDDVVDADAGWPGDTFFHLFDFFEEFLGFFSDDVVSDFAEFEGAFVGFYSVEYCLEGFVTDVGGNLVFVDDGIRGDGDVFLLFGVV